MTLEELEQLAESHYTRGPWCIDNEKEYVMTKNSDYNVFFVGVSRDADKNLVAAAPSLLATAIAAKKREEELVEALREMINSNDNGVEFGYIQTPEKDDPYWATIEKARALLKDIEQ